MKTGLIHFHSEYSFDSNLKIKEITKIIKKNNIDFVCLTDHNTIKGSERLKEECANENTEVIIGAEYTTEYGDIIGIFLKNEIKNYKNFESLIKNIKKQGGLVLLPHPYKGHKKIEYIIQYIDLVEAFNGRTNIKNNKHAEELAIKYKKPIYYSSDAHQKKNLGNCMLKIYSSQCLKDDILTNEISVLNKIPCKHIDIYISQLIKSINGRDIKLLIITVSNIFISFMKGRLFSFIGE